MATELDGTVLYVNTSCAAYNAVHMVRSLTPDLLTQSNGPAQSSRIINLTSARL